MDSKLLKHYESLGNPYDNLGLKPEATAKDIKKAYKSLALVYHPDKSSAANAADIFHKLRQSSELLLNEEERRKYDSYLSLQEENKKRLQVSGADRERFARDLKAREDQHASKQDEDLRAKMRAELKKREDEEKFRQQILEEELARKRREEKMAMESASAYELNSVKVKWGKKSGVSFTADMLKLIFAPYGSIRNIILLPKKPKAVIEYSTREEALRAVQKHMETDGKGARVIDDGLKVKMLKKKGKYEDGTGAAPKKVDLNSVNADTIKFINNFYNCDSKSVIGSARDEVKKMKDRERIIQELLKDDDLA